LKDEYLRAQQAAGAAAMPLDRAQLEALLDHVDGHTVCRRGRQGDGHHLTIW
jgi:hypothetical protein